MNDWESVSKLFIVGVKDLEFSTELKQFLKEHPVSGLALFNSPFDSPENIWADPDSALERLYEFIQQSNQHSVFLCADQEGGRVRRLRPPFIQLPPALQIGQIFQDQNSKQDKIFELFQKTARQLRLANIQLNFAPVCDLLTDDSNEVVGDRSFGKRMDVIQTLTKLYCEAFENEEVGTCLKHCPGHGSSRFDSHEQVALLQKTKEEIKQSDFRVFENCGDFATAVMTAHIAFPEAEDRIFSLDREYIHEFKKELATHLIWISDDLLQMNAVSDRKPWLDTFSAEYHYSLLCKDFHSASDAITETIKFAEKQVQDFKQEQELELRIRHSSENFKNFYQPKDFKSWKQEIVDLTEQAEELMSALGLKSSEK